MIHNPNKFVKFDDTNAYYEEFQGDLCAGKHLIFIQVNKFQYQYVKDTKVSLSKQLIQNNVWKTVMFVSLNQLIGFFFSQI